MGYRSTPFIKCAATFLNRAPVQAPVQTEKGKSFKICLDVPYVNALRVIKAIFDILPLRRDIRFLVTIYFNGYPYWQRAGAPHYTPISRLRDIISKIALMTRNWTSHGPSMESLEFVA